MADKIFEWFASGEVAESKFLLVVDGCNEGVHLRSLASAGRGRHQPAALLLANGNFASVQLDGMIMQLRASHRADQNPQSGFILLESAVAIEPFPPYRVSCGMLRMGFAALECLLI